MIQYHTIRQIRQWFQAEPRNNIVLLIILPKSQTINTHTTRRIKNTNNKHEISQGNTLSTTFFLLYINNIIKTVPNSKVYTYADDTTLIITAKTTQDLQQLAQTELNNLIKYFHNNNLVPNPTKTNYTVFKTRRNQNEIELKINDTILKQNPYSKLLGLYIQNDLKHTQTIINIIKKLQPIIHKLKYANKFVPTNTMKQLYYAHAYPHLIGSITVWGTENNKKITTYQNSEKTH